MVLFFRLTRRKRLKKCSLRFCRRHYITLRGFRSKKQSAEQVVVVLVVWVSTCVCEREKEVFFCVFLLFFFSCLLFLLIFSSVFAMMKN